MSKITGKVNYKEVLKGDTGYTFEPHVTVDGILYWTNNGGLENPLPVNLHGKQGFVFIPHVDSEGNLSWSNTGGLENPPTVNIKGDKGYFYTPHISQDGILTWSNNGDLENPQPFNISDLILNEVKESRVDTTGKTFSKLKERLDSDFKKLSESIKNNDTKEEVLQARTATTGENFMTLDDRIDHEVMRLREKIEFTMLEQEDKESHTIENTVDGMTTDMVVKGRTLANISPTGVANCNNVNDFNHNYHEVQVIQGDGFIQCTQPSTGKYNILGYDSSMLKPLTNYIHIADVEIVSNESNEDCKFHFGYMDKKKEVFINSGRGIISIVSKTKESVIGGNKSWIGIMLGTDSSISKNRSFKVYNIASYEITEEEASKEINELLEKYPIKCEGIKSFGQEEDKISILSSGKNLLNMNDFYNTLKSISNNGIFEEKKDGRDCIKITQLSNYWYKGYEKIKFKEKTRYTFTGTAFHTSDNRAILTIKYNDGSYLDISVDANGWNKFNCTSDANKTIKGIFSVYSTDTWAYIDKNTFMIEEDERATNYEPYKEDKKDILLSQYGFDEGLRGIKNITDELNSIRSVAIKRIGKREYREGDLLLENVITDKVNTYFVLEEPIETPLNENINSKTFNDKTYVNFENSIKGASSFKVPVNTNKLINDLKFEKEDLKEKFNNLNNEFENFKTYMIQTLTYKEV